MDLEHTTDGQAKSRLMPPKQCAQVHSSELPGRRRQNDFQGLVGADEQILTACVARHVLLPSAIARGLEKNFQTTVGPHTAFDGSRNIKPNGVRTREGGTPVGFIV